MTVRRRSVTNELTTRSGRIQWRRVFRRTDSNGAVAYLQVLVVVLLFFYPFLLTGSFSNDSSFMMVARPLEVVVFLVREREWNSP